MMPYEIRREGSQYCVYNKDTGKKVPGCSDSQEMAVKHMRALYAVEGGATLRKDLIAASADSPIEVCACDACIVQDIGDLLDSDDAGEDVATKAVWTTKYINDLPDSSFAYIEPNCDTKSCRHFPIKGSDGKYDAAHVRNALARAPQSPFGSKAMPKIEAAARALGIGDHGKSLGLIDVLRQAIGLEVTTSYPITLTKQSDGRTRVFMRVSNIFRDRHGEIITSDAHKEYEAYVAKSNDYPVFRLWHIPGTNWGKADLVSFDDGFLTISGLADVGKEYIAEALAERSKDIGVSHGFKTIGVEGDGYINYYRTFECSPLPRQEAANVWTAYMLAKNLEKGMGLSDKHKKFFEALHIPAETIESWDNDTKQISDLLKEAGVDYKELTGEQEQEKKELTVTLEDGTKAVIPASAIKKESESEPAPAAPPTTTTLDDVLSAINKLGTRLDDVESKQKEFEERTKDAVAATLEAAIISGKGFVASKEGEPPSDTEKKQSDDWLAELIIGGGR